MQQLHALSVTAPGVKPNSSSLSLQGLLVIFLSCRSHFHWAFSVYSQLPRWIRRGAGVEWDGLVQAREHPETTQEQQPLWLERSTRGSGCSLHYSRISRSNWIWPFSYFLKSQETQLFTFASWMPQKLSANSIVLKHSSTNGSY